MGYDTSLQQVKLFTPVDSYCEINGDSGVGDGGIDLIGLTNC